MLRAWHAPENVRQTLLPPWRDPLRSFTSSARLRRGTPFGERHETQATSGFPSHRLPSESELLLINRNPPEETSSV
jgi:hypothetical protein